MILDVVEIQKLLPHRYPFLMVDAIVEVERLKRIVGIKNVSINEYYFQGHFPGKPVMPGVLILEAVAQTGGLLLLMDIPDRDKKLLYFVAVDGARFRRPVVPGDQLRIEVNVLNWRGDFCKLEGKATVNGQLRRTREMTKREIHPQAVVAASAKLGEGVKIGPYAVVGEDVELGDGCVLHAHAMVEGPSKFGRNNTFYSFSTIGGDPQDYTFRGERTEMVAGDGNIFREYVTVSRGTQKGGGKTSLGDGNFLLAYSHIGHDCSIGSNTLFVNGATLAGHVTVEDFATIGAFCPVHQFCRIGRYAYIGASTVITQDVPPFSKIVTERETKSFGINTIGLERKGFSPERLQALKRAYRLLLRSKLNTSQALAEMKKTLSDSGDVKELIQFIESAERGIVK